MPAELDVGFARAHFPALRSGYIFGDNAGGSQAAQEVIDRLTDYLINTNTQLGADYSVSAESTRRVLVEAPAEAANLINAKSPDEIVFGSSSTLNLGNLARGLEKEIKAGDEIIITGEHEANAGPWKKLAARTGAVVKIWAAKPTKESNPYSLAYKIEDVFPLMTEKTRIIAFSACSNILGSIIPVKQFIAAIRKQASELGVRKLEISVDCVAYAPHRKIDVQDWDVDFCVFSYYKVYGPHISCLYVREASLHTSISSLVHHFLKVDKVSYKLQPGGPGYETVYATTGVNAYLKSLSASGDLDESFAAIAAHEQKLVRPLLEFLSAPEQYERGVRVIGDDGTGLDRVPTISFVVVGQNALSSRGIVRAFDETGKIGIRWGHFYAYTLIDTLDPKVDIEDSIVRISFVHYNTEEDVKYVIETLKKVLAL